MSSQNYLDENPRVGCGTCSEVNGKYGTCIMYRNVEIFGKKRGLCMLNLGDFKT